MTSLEAVFAYLESEAKHYPILHVLLKRARELVSSTLQADCHGVIPNTFIACGEGGNYCSDACVYSELERLKAEVKEARNEAATVWRAYLHERERANEAVRLLHDYDPEEGERLMDSAYKGPVERLTGRSTAEDE